MLLREPNQEYLIFQSESLVLHLSIIKRSLMSMQEGQIDIEEPVVQPSEPVIQAAVSLKVKQKKDTLMSEFIEFSYFIQIVAMLKNNPQRLKYLRQSLKFFTLIRKNIYLDRRRKIPKLDEMQPCYCKARSENEDAYFSHSNVSYNCGQRCLNRMMSTQCDEQTCNCGDLCQNRKFQKHQYANIYPKPTPGKGWGLFAGQKIYRGEFIMQYIGQVFSTKSQNGKARVKQYSSSTCTYLMKTSKGQVIDPTYKGNLARFINHSCQPNCITQKWNVLGEICIGIYSLKDIEQDQQLNFDYQFDVYSTPLTKCLCGAKRCKGYLGLKPTDISAEEWNQRLEDMTCEICQKNYDDDDVKLIICDECNKGFHIYCLTPLLEQIPEESFFCQSCQTKKQQDKKRFEKEQRERLRDTKMLILQDEVRRKQQEQSEDSISPVDQNFNRIFSFLKKQQKKVARQLLGQKIGDEQMDVEQPNIQTPRKKKTTSQIKKTTPVKRRKDAFYQVTKIAIDKFQNYLQQNPQFYQQINNFGSKKQHKGTQHQKKTMLLNKIQMQLILKSNFILFQKIGAQIYFDINSRNSTDFFLKSTEVSVIGNQEQIAMFEKIVNVTNDILGQLQIEMGITEAYMSIPAIFLKRLIGPGHIFMNQIQKATQVAVYYHRMCINEECYALQITCKLLLKGGKQNIVKAYEEIKKRVEMLEVQRLFFNPYEIKTIVNNIPNLKRKTGMAQFRIGRQSPFKDINHPFYYIQQKNKQILMIGNRQEIQKTRRQIMYFFEEPNRKEQYNFNISLYLAQPIQKSVLLGVKNQLQKQIPAIKMMIFDPTPPRKNMTLSFLGTRQNRQKAREYLFKKMQAICRQGKYGNTLQTFQDQMNYQMTKYYFKYMQNALLTKDSAFMKSWDILNAYYCEDIINYMWKAVTKSLLTDYQTLLYACFVLKDKLILKILKQNDSKRTVLDEVFDVLKHNVNRILSVYNVNNTYALKNYTSVVDIEEARKCLRDQFLHVSFAKVPEPSQRLTSENNMVEQSIKQRELSYFEKKVFKKYKNLYTMLEEERKRSRQKQEDRRRERHR